MNFITQNTQNKDIFTARDARSYIRQKTDLDRGCAICRTLIMTHSQCTLTRT